MKKKIILQQDDCTPNESHRVFEKAFELLMGTTFEQWRLNADVDQKYDCITYSTDTHICEASADSPYWTLYKIEDIEINHPCGKTSVQAIQKDVNVAKNMYSYNEFSFTWVTVQTLLDKIKDLKQNVDNLETALNNKETFDLF